MQPCSTEHHSQYTAATSKDPQTTLPTFYRAKISTHIPLQFDTNRYSRRSRNSHPIAISNRIPNSYHTWNPGCSTSHGPQPQLCQSSSDNSQPSDPLLHLLPYFEPDRRLDPQKPKPRTRKLPTGAVSHPPFHRVNPAMPLPQLQYHSKLPT